MFVNARRLDAEKVESARKEFAAMEAVGVIGVICPIPDFYPLPNVADFTSRLKGCKVFTKLDLTKGYYQVPMAPGDKPFGHFEWVRMPFQTQKCRLYFSTPHGPDSWRYPALFCLCG